MSRDLALAGGMIAVFLMACLAIYASDLHWRASAWRELASRNNELYAELRDRHGRALIIVAAAQAWVDALPVGAGPSPVARALIVAVTDWEEVYGKEEEGSASYDAQERCSFG